MFISKYLLTPLIISFITQLTVYITNRDHKREHQSRPDGGQNPDRISSTDGIVR